MENSEKITVNLKDQWEKREKNADSKETKAWFERNYERIEALFTNPQLRAFVLDPFENLITSFGNTTEEQVKRTITQVAIANAVLAALPGKLGVGVFVSMALEAYMAYRIAGHVGIDIKNPKDVFKYTGVALGVLGAIVWGFVHVLRATFSLLSLIPVNLPLTFLAELITTNAFGIIFWMLFECVREEKPLKSAKVFLTLPKKLTSLSRYQWNFLRKTLSPSTLKRTGLRLREFLTGKPVTNQSVTQRARGEMFATAAVAKLLSTDYAALEGPLGEVVLQSFRDRYGELGPDSDAGDIAAFLHEKNYSPEQMEGVIQMIKGKMFEHLVTAHENTDGDQWIARMHDDQNYPGSDIIFTSTESGQEIEVSLKATGNPSLVEEALLKWPDIPILTTSDLPEYTKVSEGISTPGWSEQELEDTARERIEELAAKSQKSYSHLDTAENLAVAGVGIQVILLWPHVLRYMRRESTQEDLTETLQKELGAGGARIAKRVILGAAVGPLYVWWLLARGVMELVPKADKDIPSSLRLEYKPIPEPST
ncbi:MAG: hypothetical protein OXC97_06940 [Candidatus Dadabacteria bacterium]|nr:hypothetical protein [Candidatus Dadabacteria bacterium]